MLLTFGIGSIVLFLLIRIISFYGIPWLNVIGERTMYIDAVEQNLRALADDKKDMLQQWFQERLGDGVSLSEFPAFRSHALSLSMKIKRLGDVSPRRVREVFANGDHYRQVVERLNIFYRNYGHYDLIELVDLATGVRTGSTNGEVSGTVAPYAKEFLAEGFDIGNEKIFVKTDESGTRSFLYMAFAVRTEEGKPFAALVLRVEPEKYLLHILHESVALGTSGEIIVIDMQKRLLFPLKYPLPDGAAAEPYAYTLRTKSAEVVALGIEALFSAHDYRGVPVLAAVRVARITPDFGLGLIVKRDESEVFEPLYQGLLITSGMTVLGLLVLIGLVALGARAIARPVERLTETAYAIAAGDLSARSPIIGKDEVAELAHAFNTMAGSIQQSHATLEQRVSERTKDLVTSNQLLRVEVEERAKAEAEIRINELRLQSIIDIMQYRASSIQEIYDYALGEALRITGSALGYIFHYHADENKFILSSWSKEVMQQCSIINPKTIYDLDTTGIWGEVVRQKQPVVVNDFQAEHPFKKGYPEGHAQLFRYMSIPVFQEEDIVAVVGVANKPTDYTNTDVLQLSLMMESVWKLVERRKAAETLSESEERFRQLAENIPEVFWVGSTDWQMIHYISPAYENVWGRRCADLYENPADWLDAILPEDRAAYLAAIPEHVLPGMIFSFPDYRIRRPDGSVRSISARAFPVKDAQGIVNRVVGIAEDITERKSLEDQLLQAQKMESVGRLAGGVAHDFNNALAIIFIALELAKMNLSEDSPLREPLDSIQTAAAHARDVTRQLLAFSRKQMVSPKVCDLNELVAALEKSLARLIGEDIDLRFAPGRDLGQIMIDPSQVDQILVNLAVNARDAMPHGGRLTIATANVLFDEAYCEEHPDFQAGRYVSLSVSDDGAGMDKETLSHIFEPFFTTKELGRGTGLGLATIFGIVKQNDGFVNVYSEPGNGTSFMLYFPQVDDAKTLSQHQPKTADIKKGTGTILLVEDDDMLCRVTRQSLESLGYTVMAATSPAGALAILDGSCPAFDLLLTDVVMPGMNGRQLSEIVSSRFPEIRVVFMSGYASDAIVHRGVLQDGVHFIQKPFSVSALAKLISEVMAR